MRASYRTDGLAHNIKSAHVPNALGKAYYRNELTDHELLSTPVYLWLFVRFRALSAKQDRARRLASSLFGNQEVHSLAAKMCIG